MESVGEGWSASTHEKPEYMTRLRLSVTLIACSLLLGLAPASAPAATRRLGERTLRVGSTGSDVKALQRLLTRAGFAVPNDGAFGEGTRTALKRFQRAARRNATGAAGPGTVKVLKAAVTSAGAVPAATSADGGVTFGAAPGPKPAEVAAQPVSKPAAPTGPRGIATLRADGTAVPPADAPAAVTAIITAANRIATLPYRYGGGHGSFDDTAYDCSGSVSYALHGAGLVDRTMVSGELEDYGSAGPGRWVTVHANAGHVYMYVAGLRFDTSGQKQSGSRWQTATRSDDGFVVRHPTGL
jgi:peptidoglycan hydrolase-like protein with peptidoglycan-binding domain